MKLFFVNNRRATIDRSLIRAFGYLPFFYVNVNVILPTFIKFTMSGSDRSRKRFGTMIGRKKQQNKSERSTILCTISDPHSQFIVFIIIFLIINSDNHTENHFYFRAYKAFKA